MVDISHSSWAERDADNNSPSPNGIQNGFPPSTVGPILQATKAAVKRSYNQINAIYTTTGTAAALVLTFTVAPAGLIKGARYAFFASQTNTGAMTLNVNGLGAKSILQQDGAALAAGQIVTGSAITVIYDGAAFRLENYASNPKFSGTVSADAVAATTMTATTITGTYTGNGAALTALNASQLTSGTLPNARISGAYDGITTLAQTGMHTISTGGEAIRLISPNDASDPFITFFKTIDGVATRQAYIQSTDGTGGGILIYNERASVEGTGLNGIVIRNTGGVDGLGHRVGSATNTVWTSGNLPTPAVQATQIVAGNGLSGGGTIAANRTITLGTPGTITNTSTNTVSATSHTHELVITAADITGTLGFIPANIASPALTGTPTAPTQAVGNNSTRLATTAFVSSAIDIAAAANGIFYSAQTNWTNGTRVAIPHTLGRVPKMMGWTLVCTVANNGYTVGMTTHPFTTDKSNNDGSGVVYGGYIYADANNFYVTPGPHGQVIQSAATGGQMTAVNTQWQIVAYGN